VDYAYISADNHIDSFWLPGNVWQDRVAAKYREAAPRIVETDGASRWMWEGKLRGEAAAGSSNPTFLKRFYKDNLDELPPGALPPSTPSILLDHMDRSKVYAGVFYGDTRKWDIADRDLRLEVYRAYNDFVMELNAVDPDRLLLLPQLPNFAPEHVLAEAKRLVGLGAKALEFSVFDAGDSICSTSFDELYDFVSEAGVPLCAHIGDRAGVAYPPNENGLAMAHFSIAPFSVARYIPQFVFAGAFEKFPKLNVSFAECRVGWLPFLFAWMDRQAEIRPPDNIKLSLRPTDYVKRNMSFTFEDDVIGGHMMEYDWSLLKDCAIWGSDYPHEQGSSDPTATIDRVLAGLTADEKRYVTRDHAARIFNVTMPQAVAV
jgi:predicted TIM-barrel fold metal-dependent hydrolase